MLRRLFSTRMGPLGLYQHRVNSGLLTTDRAQVDALTILESLSTSLQTYTPPARTEPVAPVNKGFLSNLLSTSETVSLPETIPTSLPKGVYLHGSVGTGKTFVMDLFYEANAHVEKRRRVHFHAFMLDVHRRIHRWRVNPDRGADDHDPIPPLADKLVDEAWLLCFDEFQVNDIADASILNRLFQRLYARGAVVVSTSNRAPHELYERGLQRELFLPFIELVKERNTVHELDNGIDYRLKGDKGKETVIHVGDDEADQALQAQFAKLVGDVTIKSESLALLGTEEGSSLRIDVPRSAKGCALFTFDELCRANVGAAEFITLANHFHTVAVMGVPRMTVSSKNEARRFIVLIDELYEHRCKFLCSTRVPIDALFVGPAASTKSVEAQTNVTDVESALRDELLEKKGVSDFADTLLDEASLFTGAEEAFAFDRARSRLEEMQSEQYLTTKWMGQKPKH